MFKLQFNTLFLKLKDLKDSILLVQLIIMNQTIFEVPELLDLDMGISLISQKHNHILKVTMIQLVPSQLAKEHPLD